MLHVAEAVSARSCPMSGGQFPLRVGASTSGCATYLRSGCHDSSVIDVVDACSPRPGATQVPCILDKPFLVRRRLCAPVYRDLSTQDVSLPQ